MVTMLISKRVSQSGPVTGFCWISPSARLWRNFENINDLKEMLTESLTARACVDVCKERRQSGKVTNPCQTKDLFITLTRSIHSGEPGWLCKLPNL